MTDTVRVLIFGCRGQVGSSLVDQLGKIPGFEPIGVDFEHIDLTQTSEIPKFIDRHSPHWVINSAAHTAVDKAEQEIELSDTLNAAVPDVMSRHCAEFGIGFFHYSTDYVFDGGSEIPYSEDDVPHPQSVYGSSKLKGEQSVLSNHPDAIIFRTAWVYSHDGNNFVNTMLRLSEERDHLKVVNDQYGSPTLAEDLARVTLSVLVGIQTGLLPHAGGLYHATGGGVTNWYEFCQTIFKHRNIDNVHVEPIPTHQYPTPAKRPKFSVLSNEKLKKTFGQELPHWEDGLRRCLG